MRQDSLSEVREMTDPQFLERYALLRPRRRHKLSYLSDALKLRFRDVAEMRTFLISNVAREFNRFSFGFEHDGGWQDGDWALLHRLQAQAIELNLRHFRLGAAGVASLAPQLLT